MDPASSSTAPPKRRGYRACLPCRLKKAKCDLGDPDSPSEPPCRRCRRELRECVFAASEKPFARKAAPSLPRHPSTSSTSPFPPDSPAPGRSNFGHAHTTHQAHLHQVFTAPPRQPDTPSRQDRLDGDGDEEEEEEEDEEEDRGRRLSRSTAVDERDIGSVLYASALNNPADALRMLATASSLDSPRLNGPDMARRGSSEVRRVNGGWATWPPIEAGILTREEAEKLFKVFQTQMSILYPLLPDDIFYPHHIPALTSTEYLLLGTMVTIASRYAISDLLPSRQSTIHSDLARWLREQIAYIYDGSPVLRHVSSVESLLLLSEWPPRPSIHPFLASAPRPDPQDIPSILSSSTQYDSLSWSYIGCAVRLAQELGIDNPAHYATENSTRPSTWLQERALRTWIFSYNADRHVSVRLGRNAVIQTHMSSQWWEKVCKIASDNFYARGFKDEWAEPMPQGFNASLIGTIQDRLYPNREITRASLRTGYWEGFLRSLSHELQHMRRSSESILKQGNIASTLLTIEIDYLLLYANTISLRALQARSQRRVKANDIFSISATLLNLQEGPWVIESINAAQAILRNTVEVLHAQGHLRLAPARIFQRVVFAATFLFKSLAVGVVEHGQGNLLQLLDSTITALEQSRLDHDHICSGFAALLRRLHVQYQARTHPSGSSTPHLAAPQTQQQNPFAPVEEYSPFERNSTTTENNDSGLGGAPFQWLPDRQMLAVGEQQDVLFHSLWASDAFSSNQSLIETLCGDASEYGMQF